MPVQPEPRLRCIPMPDHSVHAEHFHQDAGKQGVAAPRRPMVVHLSGIAGAGMSSLAGLFCARGDRVSGSDSGFYPPAQDVLAALPVHLREGFSAAHIPAGVDLCVVGNIVSRGNPEAEAVLNLHLPYTSMPEALYSHFIRGNRSIVVAGTHGKTTTSAFIAFLLTCAGRDPGYFIGGQPLDLPSGYKPGCGNDFVSEGDEYETAFFDRSSKFLKYHADILVLTPAEYDHIDFFPSEALYAKAFSNLVNQVPSEGRIINCTDYPMNREIVAGAFTPVIGYGATGRDDISIRSICGRPGGGFSFALAVGKRRIHLESPLSGTYNAGNLAAGVAVGLYLEIPLPVIRDAVSRFQGVARRLRRLRTIGESHFYEDFAHHPTSLARMLESLRQAHPHHYLVCLFEPRSRTLMRRDFQERLIGSLSGADEVVIRRVVHPGSPFPELDAAEVAASLQRTGVRARVADDDASVRDFVRELDLSRPVVVVAASNGSFGGLPRWLAEADLEKGRTTI